MSSSHLVLPGGAFIATFNASLFPAQHCLTRNYYGRFGASAVFLPDAACIGIAASGSSDFQSHRPAILHKLSDAMHSPDRRLVWLEQQSVDESLLAQEKSWEIQLEDFLASADAKDFQTDSAQRPLGHDASVRLVTLGLGRNALVSVSEAAARTLDTTLPRFWRTTPLPLEPVPFLPVPPPAVDRVKDLLAALKFDPVIASIVNGFSVAQARNDVRWLTGEDGLSGVLSRHSFSDGARTAAAWLKERFEETGATCELKPFLIGFAPNVVCRYPSTVNTTATVLLSAHYDSRGSFGSSRAPGADDDGSGTTALLGMARVIKHRGVTFRSNVEFVAFAGEEQGLFGSKGYSRELRAEDRNITLMIQADMVAYRAKGEPPQLGLPDLIGTDEVTQLVANVSAIYSPELQVGVTSACCSDHQSFHEQGFPATQVFERAGPIADPMYHNSGDLSKREGYDFEQMKSIAKVELATLLHAAGYDIAK